MTLPFKLSIYHYHDHGYYYYYYHESNYHPVAGLSIQSPTFSWKLSFFLFLIWVADIYAQQTCGISSNFHFWSFRLDTKPPTAALFRLEILESAAKFRNSLVDSETSDSLIAMPQAIGMNLMFNRASRVVDVTLLE